MEPIRVVVEPASEKPGNPFRVVRYRRGGTEIYRDRFDPESGEKRASSIFTLAEKLELDPEELDYLDGAICRAATRRAERAPALTWRPYPVEALPEPIRSFVVEGTEALGCDPAYLALPLLTALASAVGSAVEVRVTPEWAEPCVLWSAIVGESGSMKSPALKLALGPVHDRDLSEARAHQEQVAAWERDSADYEAQLQEWKRTGRGRGQPPPERPTAPTCVRHLCQDVTIEALAGVLEENPRGVLVAHDELAGLFAGFERYSGGRSSSDAQWLQCWSANPLRVHRKTGERRSLIVPRPVVSITGGIQPAILARQLGREHFESGLAARFLFAMPPYRRVRLRRAEIRPEHREAVAAVFDWLWTLEGVNAPEGNARPLAMRLSPAAYRRFEELFDAIEDRRETATGELSAALAKFRGYGARLALLIQLVELAAGNAPDNDGATVDRPAVEAAATLVAWHAHETERVYQALKETDEERERRELFELVEGRGGRMSPRDLMQAKRRYRGDAEGAEAALAGLVEVGRAAWRTEPAGATGGRPSRYVELIEAKNDGPW